MNYDLVIIGAGPAGLALAHCCSYLKLNILNYHLNIKKLYLKILTQIIVKLLLKVI